MIMPVPPDAASRASCQSSARPRGSIPLVGLSRRSKSGSLSVAQWKASRRCGLGSEEVGPIDEYTEVVCLVTFCEDGDMCLTVHEQLFCFGFGSGRINGADNKTFLGR